MAPRSAIFIQFEKDNISRSLSGIAGNSGISSQFPAIPDRLLEQNDALKRGDLDAFAAPRIAASEKVVDAHHVVACIFEASAVIFAGTRRQRWFLSPRDPADLIFRRLFA